MTKQITRRFFLKTSIGILIGFPILRKCSDVKTGTTSYQQIDRLAKSSGVDDFELELQSLKVQKLVDTSNNTFNVPESAIKMGPRKYRLGWVLKKIVIDDRPYLQFIPIEYQKYGKLYSIKLHPKYKNRDTHLVHNDLIYLDDNRFSFIFNRENLASLKEKTGNLRIYMR